MPLPRSVNVFKRFNQRAKARQVEGTGLWREPEATCFFHPTSQWSTVDWKGISNHVRLGLGGASPSQWDCTRVSGFSRSRRQVAVKKFNFWTEHCGLLTGIKIREVWQQTLLTLHVEPRADVHQAGNIRGRKSVYNLVRKIEQADLEAKYFQVQEAVQD